MITGLFIDSCSDADGDADDSIRNYDEAMASENQTQQDVGEYGAKNGGNRRKDDEHHSDEFVEVTLVLCCLLRIDVIYRRIVRRPSVAYCGKR